MANNKKTKKRTTYLFILGREPALSLSEIFTVTKGISPQVLFIQESVAVIEFDDSQIEFNQLGGVIKVGQVIGQFKRNQITEKISEELIKKQGKSKLVFGVSWYGKNADKTFGKIIKNTLKTKGVISRFISAKDDQLSAASIIQNQLMKSGGEYIIVPQKNNFLLAQTVFIQDIDSWSKRDFKKPARDMKRGMIPPKLARIMVNLAGKTKGSTILDPFCGVGTIAMEATLLGHHAILSDANPEAVKATKKNIEWLKKQHPEINTSIIQSDAREISKRIKKLYGVESIDAIVTEPYLGNETKLTDAQLVVQAEKLSHLYLDSLKIWKAILKKDARVVMVIPLFKTKKALIELPVYKKIEDLGYNFIKPSINEYNIEDKLSPKGNLLYQRQGQRVWREIIILSN